MSNLIDEIIGEQKDLTAVERFSEIHEKHGLKREETYRDLIPLSQPQSGQQYAFEVDLDVCTGCKACVVGCHSMNGLEETETWRKTGALQSVEEGLPFQQTVTTACHHCVEPGCLQGCPVQAYDKDEVTGIVKHLDDQCFGCRYCEIKCPYGVPQYSERLGVVRKCDMCSSRLADGEAPACVQSCPNQAIKITIVDQKGAASIAEQSFGLIKDSPDSSYTTPTTVFKSEREHPENTRAADVNQVKPEHPHWPLVLMLSLTQVSVGGWLMSLLVSAVSSDISFADHGLTLAFSLVLGLIGLGVAPMHLGRPHLAFRAFLGFRTSWLSREMLTFGPYPLLAGGALLMIYQSLWGEYIPLAYELSGLAPWLGVATVLVGLAGVFCSAMIYIDTPRPFWAHIRTLLKFKFTALSGGALLVACFSSHLGLQHFAPTFLGLVFCGAKMYFEIDIFQSKVFDIQRTVHLLKNDLRSVYQCRRGLGYIGGLVLPLVALCLPSGVFVSLILTLAVTLWIVAEVMERYLFFTSVVPPRMPGEQLAS